MTSQMAVQKVTFIDEMVNFPNFYDKFANFLDTLHKNLV